MEYFLQNSKTIFFGCFSALSQKSDSVSFLPLGHLNFVRSFWKILWAILEKMRLPTDILTYWQWWIHMTPFHLKARIQKNITRQNWKIWGNLIFEVTFCLSITVHLSCALATLKCYAKTEFHIIFKNKLLLKLGIIALNYKKIVFKMVLSSKIELSIKCKTTESASLSLSVSHAWFLDHTDFCHKYFGLTLELSCTDLWSIFHYQL